MNTKYVGKRVSFAIAASLLVTAMQIAPAQASPVWTEYLPTSTHPTNDPIDILYTRGHGTATASVHYTPGSAAQIWYYNGNISNQSPSNMMTVTESQFGLGSGALQSVSACDSACSDTFVSSTAFDYLAVHFGQGELLFHWLSPVTDFTISCLPRGISNYRAYGNVAATPLPSGALLFATGLLAALPLVSKRRNRR